MASIPSTRTRSLRPATREAIYGYAMASPWLVGFTVFTVFPMVAALVLSFFRIDFLTETRFVGFSWWESVVSDRTVRKAFYNTGVYVAAVVPLNTVLALMIAVLLNQGIAGQSIWRTVYYLPSVVSGVAVSLLWQWLYHPEVGLINSMLYRIGIQGPRWIYDENWAMPAVIIMTLWGAGSAMLIYLAGLRDIPTSLYEAAEIDGAGPVLRFFRITLPMLSPTIFFNVIMNIIAAWQVFTQAFVMTDGGPNNATLTMVLHIYRTAFENFYFGYASAQAWALFVVIMVFVLIALKTSRSWVHYERV